MSVEHWGKIFVPLASDSDAQTNAQHRHTEEGSAIAPYTKGLAEERRYKAFCFSN
jgi:hypothetical protein